MPQPSTHARRRRWLSFSLRSLLLLVLLISIGLAWLTSLSRKNDELVESAERIAGVVEFESIGPEWLRAVLGENAPRQPKRLLVPEVFIPQAIELIEEHPSIRELNIKRLLLKDEDKWYLTYSNYGQLFNSQIDEAFAFVKERLPGVDVSTDLCPGYQFDRIEVQEWADSPPYWVSYLDLECGEYKRMERLLLAYVTEHPDQWPKTRLNMQNFLSLAFWKVPIRVGDARFTLAVFQEHFEPTFLVCLIHQDEIIDLRMLVMHRSFGDVAPLIEDIDNDGLPDVSLRAVPFLGLYGIKTIPGHENKSDPPLYYAAYRITPDGFVSHPLVTLHADEQQKILGNY